jgi:hypothetical protein
MAEEWVVLGILVVVLGFIFIPLYLHNEKDRYNRIDRGELRYTRGGRPYNPKELPDPVAEAAARREARMRRGGITTTGRRER